MGNFLYGHARNMWLNGAIGWTNTTYSAKYKIVMLNGGSINVGQANPGIGLTYASVGNSNSGFPYVYGMVPAAHIYTSTGTGFGGTANPTFGSGIAITSQMYNLRMSQGGSTGIGVSGGTALADNIYWNNVSAPGAGVSMAAFLMYYDGTIEGTVNPLIAYFDTAVNLPIVPNGGDITIQWDTTLASASPGGNGIFRI
jgi:hypothetical protein